MKTNHIIVLGISSLLTVLLIAFFSNTTLRLLKKDKIWAHKINTINQLIGIEQSFKGIELDIVFDQNINNFDIHHPPEQKSGILLTSYFKTLKDKKNHQFWLDFKNPSINIERQSAETLDSILRLFNINKENIIVESGDAHFLKSFREKGFKTSYYLPTDLYQLDNQKLLNQIHIIRKNISTENNTYISTDFKDYQIIKKHFPVSKKLLWFNTYGSMNVFKARLFLFEILFDDKVDVLLIDVK